MFNNFFTSHTSEGFGKRLSDRIGFPTPFLNMLLQIDKSVIEKTILPLLHAPRGRHVGWVIPYPDCVSEEVPPYKKSI